MEYNNDHIKEVLSKGKKPFYRLKPICGGDKPITNLSYQKVTLPKLQAFEVKQDQYLAELSPTGHKIFNREVYPDKLTVHEFGEDGKPLTYGWEPISRMAFAFQRVLATKVKNHMTGKEVKFYLTELDKDMTEETKTSYNRIKQAWVEYMMHNAFDEVVESKETTGDGALYFYLENGKLGWSTFGFSKGDVLIPHYDELGRMDRFYRYFSLDEEEAMMVIDKKHVYYFKNTKDKSRREWVQYKDPVMHGFSDIPVAYIRGKVAWDDVQSLIEEFEWAFSQFCESNAYFAFPILFLKGTSVQALPKKSSQGKVIQGTDPDSSANFITGGGSPEASKIQFEILTNQIFFGSFTVNITPDILKSSGDMPGSGIRMVMHPEIEKAIEAKKEYDVFLKKVKELFTEGLGIVDKATTKYKEVDFIVEVDIYVPENTKEYVDILNASVSMGTLSKQTGAELHPEAVNDEYQRLVKQKEEEDAGEYIAQPDGTKIHKENVKQKIAAQ